MCFLRSITWNVNYLRENLVNGSTKYLKISCTHCFQEYSHWDIQRYSVTVMQIHNFKWLYRLNGKPTLTEWDNYEERHVMKHVTPLYFMISVRAWLNNHFPGRWTGRRGPTERSPRLLKRKKHWVCVFQVSEVLESILNRGSTVVKVLCYKSEGRWFDPNWC